MDDLDVLDLEEEEETQKGRFLTFALSNEIYGIEIQYVTEIIVIQPITQVPDMEDYIRGIINLRGKIIPVVDVRLRFKKAFRDYNDRTCVIVVELNDISIGLIVDSVSEVIPIPDSDIVDPPDVKKGGSNYIRGIGKVDGEIKLLLDCERLLSEDETEALYGIQ